LSTAPGPDVEPAHVYGERIRLRVGFIPHLTAICPLSSVEAENVTLVIAGGKQVAVVDTHRLDALAVGNVERRPFAPTLIPKQPAGLERRRSGQLAAVHDQAANGFGPWKLAAVDPLFASRIAIDLAPQIGILGLGQRRAPQAVL